MLLDIGPGVCAAPAAVVVDHTVVVVVAEEYSALALLYIGSVVGTLFLYVDVVVADYRSDGA